MASPQTVRNNVYSYDMRDLRLLASRDPDKFSHRQVEATFIYNSQRAKFMGMITVEEDGTLTHHSPVGANPILPTGRPTPGGTAPSQRDGSSECSLATGLLEASVA